MYKDLIPGYRIRELTEIEQAEKVRDEVRRLREGEKGLIKSYKQYLKMLEAEIKRKCDAVCVVLRRKVDQPLCLFRLLLQNALRYHLWR